LAVRAAAALRLGGTRGVDLSEGVIEGKAREGLVRATRILMMKDTLRAAGAASGGARSLDSLG